MNAYEKLIEQMRKAGRFYNPQVPELGTVGYEGRIKTGSVILNKNDYLVSSNLREAFCIMPVRNRRFVWKKHTCL